jgi:glycosyltransferase involved in cell wall biosynthesis
MRIFEVIPQLSTGGAERFVVDLCNELSLNNIVVLVVLWPLRGDQSFFQRQIRSEVIVECINKKPGFDPRVFLQFYKLIRRYQPEVIHSHIDSILYTGLFQVFCSAGVHTVHSLARHEAKDAFKRLLRKFLFRLRLVRPVTISKAAQRDFDSYYHVASELICNGRNIPPDLVVSEDVIREINSYRLNKETRILIQLAHVDNVKRQLLMARVAKRLFDEGYNFSVLFIGSNTRVPAYTDEVRAIMPENCHFLGEKQNPLEYLKYGGAFCLCSSVEGFPISLIEAMGVGAIPICTPVGGIKDVIVDGENGILASDTTEDSYYNALRRFLLLSSDEILLMSHHALESYSPYSMKECAYHYSSFFKALLNKQEH